MTRVDRAAEVRALDRLVHVVLLAGLALSAVLLLAGVALVIARRGEFPPEVLPLRAALVAAAHLRSRGFFSLGLVALIATPILRVVGSLVTFLWERDYRFVAVTAAVLVVLAASLLLGRG